MHSVRFCEELRDFRVAGNVPVSFFSYLRCTYDYTSGYLSSAGKKQNKSETACFFFSRIFKDEKKRKKASSPAIKHNVCSTLVKTADLVRNLSFNPTQS